MFGGQILPSNSIYTFNKKYQFWQTWSKVIILTVFANTLHQFVTFTQKERKKTRTAAMHFVTGYACRVHYVSSNAVRIIQKSVCTHKGEPGSFIVTVNLQSHNAFHLKKKDPPIPNWFSFWQQPYSNHTTMTQSLRQQLWNLLCVGTIQLLWHLRSSYRQKYTPLPRKAFKFGLHKITCMCIYFGFNFLLLWCLRLG